MAGTTDFELNPARLVEIMRTWFHARDRLVVLSDDQYILSQKVAWETAISKFLLLPGLIGFWPMSSVQRSTGNAYDLSGQGRTLTYNGNPTYNIYNGFVPYIDFDGVGDFLSRADETDLDVLGSETIYYSGVRGLTLGGYFWLENLAGSQGLISKWVGAGNQRSYDLLFSGSFFARVNSTGAAPGGNFTATSLVTPVTNQWFFIVNRFIPSLSIDIFVTNPVTSILTKDTNTTSPVASIFNSTAALEIGRITPSLLTGRASLCFLCANALSDALIDALFQQTRRLFGV